MSRLSNFAILLFSPLLLVRILEVDDYGRYQEFMIYATLLILICGSWINKSLTYFLPKYPALEREYVGQNSFIVAAYSLVCVAIIILLRRPLAEVASFDFAYPLAAYVFCFVNLNWLELYWIAKRRADLVLYYSAGRLLARVTVLLVVAYTTRDINSIIWSLVSVEALRLILVFVFLHRTNLLFSELNYSRIKEQVQFAGPVGLASLMQQAGRSIGKLYIGSAISPIALAYYAVSSYTLRAIVVVHSAICDAVFPELVGSKANENKALDLWQRTTVVFCVLLFPMFVVLNYFAELTVTTLFTDEYLPAVPVFQVYLFWLLRRCFSLDMLLRTRGKTGFMIAGSGLSLLINLLLMIVLYRHIGLIGPAIALIVSEILAEIYYAVMAKKEFGISVASIVDWTGIIRVSISCILALPVLAASTYIPGPVLLQAVLSSTAYVAACWAIAYQLGVSDIARIVNLPMKMLRRT